ncbi:MAG: hypothetical protein HBSAPP04_06470 [Ignavibacteriaceae bacterium]|nr:MAG: hypothetical protein HBSAPP04_06470 [Ignavibacteriaceae bacterium]
MKELIREVFESGFNENQYTRFISELLVDYDRSKYFQKKTYFPDMFKGFVTSYSRLGTYHSPAGEKIDNLIVYLRNSHSIDAARNAQRNFVAHHLKMHDDKDAALVAFVSPGSPEWRFSLVKSTIENVRQESGRFKLTRLFSPAKRWSYLVGESERSHTAQSMFLPLIESKQKPALNDLIGAFDIESVTDEFFAEYKQLFFNVKEAVDHLINSDKLVATEFTEKGISPVDFSKKLLGQVVFLYFLQKKGWLGVPEEGKWGNGSKRFLRDLFERKQGTATSSTMCLNTFSMRRWPPTALCTTTSQPSSTVVSPSLTVVCSIRSEGTTGPRPISSSPTDSFQTMKRRRTATRAQASSMCSTGTTSP